MLNVCVTVNKQTHKQTQNNQNNNLINITFKLLKKIKRFLRLTDDMNFVSKR